MSIAQEYRQFLHSDAMMKMADPAVRPYERIMLRMREKWPTRYPKNKPVTQRQIAAVARVRQPSVAKWKRGGPIDPSNVVSLAVSLDVAVEWLQTGRGPKFPGPANDALLDELWQVITRMDEPHRMELARYASYLTGDQTGKAG